MIFILENIIYKYFYYFYYSRKAIHVIKYFDVKPRYFYDPDLKSTNQTTWTISPMTAYNSKSQKRIYHNRIVAIFSHADQWRTLMVRSSREFIEGHVPLPSRANWTIWLENDHHVRRLSSSDNDGGARTVIST